MQIKLGVKVYGAGDQQVGVLSHIIVDPRPKEITHLVIQKGHPFTIVAPAIVALSVAVGG
jgi:hypothetical protein